MIEKTILSALTNDQEYVRKVIPYINREYFQEMGDQIVFSLIKEHFTKYNSVPNKTTLMVELEKKNIKENFFNQAKETLDNLVQEPINVQWLVDATEDWCKRRSFFNAIVHASTLLEKDDTAVYHGALDVVSKALSVSFDSNLGSDYFESAADRYDAMKEGKEQLPTTFEIFNKVTKGGFVNPSLTIFIAPTGVGKSLALCNIALSYLQLGKNVLYFTMEMSETQVENRIDLNMMDLREDQIKIMEKSQYLNRIMALKKKFSGKLRTKEYPSRSVHAGHFRYFIEELKLKEGFIPDVIIVDYLNICAAQSAPKNAPTHEYVGQIAVELRAIGQEYHCPIFTATQTNREGTKASDFDATDVAESWGVTHHADYIYGLVETEELAKMGQMKVKRLKDRYNDYRTWYPYFIIGVDKTKQKFYDIQQDDESGTIEQEQYVDEEFSRMLS